MAKKIITEINVSEQKEKEKKKQEKHLGKFKEVDSRKFKEVKKEQEEWDEESEEDAEDFGSSDSFYPGEFSTGVLKSNEQKENLEQAVASAPEAAGKVATTDKNVSYNAPEYGSDSYKLQEEKEVERRISRDDAISSLQLGGGNAVISNLQAARGQQRQEMTGDSAWNEARIEPSKYEGVGAKIAGEFKGASDRRKPGKVI